MYIYFVGVLINILIYVGFIIFVILVLVKLLIRIKNFKVLEIRFNLVLIVIYLRIDFFSLRYCLSKK